jgi:hypothetical protein
VEIALRLAEAEDIRRSRSQIVTLKRGQNIKHLPAAFTEHGAIMADLDSDLRVSEVKRIRAGVSYY